MDANLSEMIKAIEGGQWLLVLGLALVAITETVKRTASTMGKEIPAEWQPWLAAALGVVGSIGACLAAGLPWWTAALTGGAAGATASGLWSLLARYLLKRKD